VGTRSLHGGGGDRLDGGETVTLDDNIRELIRAEIRKLVRTESLTEAMPEIADAALHEKAATAAARIRRARGTGGRNTR
jgi:hypothetical protein